MFRMNWPIYLIGGALSAVWLLWRYKNRRMIQMGNKLPGPPTIPLLGNALMFMCQPEAFIKVLKDLMTEYGNVSKFWLGPDLNIVINNPDDLKVSNTYEPRIYHGRSFSIYEVVFRRMTKWYMQIDPVFWMSTDYYFQKHFIKIMTDFCEVILQHRTERLRTLEDSKRELMNSEDDSSVNTELSVIDRFLLSQELNKDELVQETFTIFTSSQEATAKISSYVLLMMAYHPKCQEKLYAEIKSIIGDEDRYVTDDDLKRMPYLEMVFKEVLRLYPIGAILQRTVNEDIAISDYTLPAGCSLVAPIFHLHRDPRFWTEPDRFDPERFNPENVKTRNPNAYIPFSLGQMDCLGRFFGTKLVKTICVRVLREFELSSTETYDDLRVAISISVVSLNGYPIILNPRKTKN
ncbi:hypothetical protein HF086_012179 [Spodoptera exigua]|uniref:Cytochrome p450 n=1 Tax=Spodoptera exigua TaxID=7107 RepID=A0A922M7D4_SPOEX|nr:hypothetical protein HF086_012179 [Spodoptera exigua]